MPITLDFITEQLAETEAEQKRLPQAFNAENTRIEASIDQLIAQAGIMDQVRALRAERDDIHRRIQSAADFLGGKIETLQQLEKVLREDMRLAQEQSWAQRAVNLSAELGFDVTTVTDPETRTRLLLRNPETIELMRRVLAPKPVLADYDTPSEITEA
jgi:hypothetical protein